MLEFSFLSLALVFCPRPPSPEGFKAPHLLYTQLLQYAAWTTREACMLFFLSRPTQALGPPFFCSCSPCIPLAFAPPLGGPGCCSFLLALSRRFCSISFLAFTTSDGTRRHSVCLPDLGLQDSRCVNSPYVYRSGLRCAGLVERNYYMSQVKSYFPAVLENLGTRSSSSKPKGQ